MWKILYKTLCTGLHCETLPRPHGLELWVKLSPLMDQIPVLGSFAELVKGGGTLSEATTASKAWQEERKQPSHSPLYIRKCWEDSPVRFTRPYSEGLAIITQNDTWGSQLQLGVIKFTIMAAWCFFVCVVFFPSKAGKCAIHFRKLYQRRVRYGHLKWHIWIICENSLKQIPQFQLIGWKIKKREETKL